MLIVSQNENIMVNFDNVQSIDIVADLDGTGKVPYKLYYETSTKREELGKYTTEKRAKEVFEEIIKYNSIFEEIKALGGLDARRFIERQRYYKFDTYRMPKE